MLYNFDELGGLMRDLQDLKTILFISAVAALVTLNFLFPFLP